MWSPTHKLSLPSPEEQIHAYNAIEQLEVELKAPVEAVERGGAQVEAITTHLDERKAWLAQVRKLPLEILSEIFVLVSDVDPFGPIFISEVNRHWRQVVLSTPRAWSRIYLSEDDHPITTEYIKMWLPRSHPISLHLCLPNSYMEDVEGSRTLARDILLKAVQRFQCLNLSKLSLELFKDNRYPNLTRITITYSSTNISPAIFNCVRFPGLRFLDCGEGMWGQPEDSIGTIYQLPPLHYLFITFKEHLAWIKLVQSCATSLKGLELRGYFTYGGTLIFPITFPVLETLYIEIWDEKLDDYVSWPIQATTPALVSYEEFWCASPPTSRSTLHSDLRTLTSLMCPNMPDLSQLPALRNLRVKLSLQEVAILIGLLEQEVSLSPSLQLLKVVVHPRDGSTELALYERLRKTRTRVDLRFAGSFSASDYLESKACGEGMPCRGCSTEAFSTGFAGTYRESLTD